MKKSLFSLTAALPVLVAWSTVLAAPDTFRKVETGVSQLSWRAGQNAVADVVPVPIETTGFEVAEGFEAGFQMCVAPGFPDFRGCVTPAVAACPAEGGPPPAADDNCCANWPNVANGWFAGSTNRSCIQPEITTVHPSPLKGESIQHMRFKNDPLIEPTRVLSVFSPVNGVGTNGPSTIKFDISADSLDFDTMFFAALSNQAGFLLRMLFVPGADPTLGYIFARGNLEGAYNFLGCWADPDDLCGTGPRPLGSYHQVEIKTEPCRTAGSKIDYYFDGGLVLTKPISTLPAIDLDRVTWQYFYNAGPAIWDIDNFSITRGENCPVVCGDGFVDAPETCEEGVSPGCNPGHTCNPPGSAGQCTCTRICTLANPCILENGDNGPYFGPFDAAFGGIFLYDADTESVSLSACGSTYDTRIFYWGSVSGPDAGGANDDCCDPKDPNCGSFGVGSDPTAACFGAEGSSPPFPACACWDNETPGDNLFIAQLNAPGGANTLRLNVNKKFECGSTGNCSDSCTGGACGLGNCDETGTPGACTLDSGHCTAGNDIGATCTTDPDCDRPKPDVCVGDCVASNDPSRIGQPCKGDRSCDDPAGAGGDGICSDGFCQANPGIACGGDAACPPTITPGTCTLDSGTCTAGAVGPCTVDTDCDVAATNLCDSGPRTGDACQTDAECNECTAGNVGADCAGAADCNLCTSGPLAGSVCFSNADCGGKFCSSGDVGASCLADADCYLGEKIPGGACCDGETGLCEDGADVNEADCLAVSEQASFHRNKTCEIIECIRHSGACCDGTPKAVHCTDGTFPEDCDGPNQVWLKGGTCDPDQCPALTLGACCNTLEGSCTDNAVAADCSGAQRVFTLDGTCENVPCDAVLGACCDTDPFGGCTDVTNAECQGDKLVWTKLGSCATTPCVHSAIPTVSTWGLAVLTLLLLIGAKIYFGRRQAAAA